MKTITIKIIQWSDIKQWWINHFGVRTIKENAREQRKIDIDKACEWFESYLSEIGYPDDWCRDSEVQESGEKRFRKFMEEEI